MTVFLGIGIPLGYIAMWTLIAKMLYRRYHPIEGEKRNCDLRAEHPEWHDGSGKYCRECGQVNKQWWQEQSKTAAVGLSDANLAWDCIAQALLWPLTILLYVMLTTITTDPPRSPREVQAENERQAAKISDLERDNKRLEKALEDAK
jgi:hypothetical protein